MVIFNWQGYCVGHVGGLLWWVSMWIIFEDPFVVASCLECLFRCVCILWM